MLRTSFYSLLRVTGFTSSHTGGVLSRPTLSSSASSGRLVRTFSASASASASVQHFILFARRTAAYKRGLTTKFVKDSVLDRLWCSRSTTVWDVKLHLKDDSAKKGTKLHEGVRFSSVDADRLAATEKVAQQALDVLNLEKKKYD
ncbi:hypothetical protein JCM8547_006703 [Rhodosporidiobolus lusitaniae]